MTLAHLIRTFIDINPFVTFFNKVCWYTINFPLDDFKDYKVILFATNKYSWTEYRSQLSSDDVAYTADKHLMLKLIFQ